MNRYIDAEWLLGVAKLSDGIVDVDDIYNAPSIDIVWCVECKKLRDCRYDSWQTGVIDMGYVGWCKKTSRLGDVTYVKVGDFCSYGERGGE